MKIEKLLAIPFVMSATLMMDAYGADYLVCDFEQCQIGETFKVWNSFGSESGTTAVVEADPKNANNKVLHIVNRGWNDFVEFELPEEYAGYKFSNKVEKVSVRICRHKNDPCGEWKNFEIWVGDDKLWSESWPSYGNVNTWKIWDYVPWEVPFSNTSNLLRLGFNSENSDYYIDNIRLSGTDYAIYEEGVLDFSDPGSTSSSYSEFNTAVDIPAGTSLDVYTSRYSYWMSPLRGAGKLNIHSGGERTYLGNAGGASCPDWSKFSGEVHVMPWPEVNSDVKAGFYGVILGHGGAKFDSDNTKRSIREGRFTTFLADNSVTLHEGAAMAGEDGNNARAHRIARLTMEPGSRLMGYYKGNKTKGVYYLLGSDGTDSELAGRITAEGTSLVGIVKEGGGTYSITGNDNRITGFVQVVGGKVLVSNDAAAARAGKLSGAIGIGENSVGAIVYTGGCLGGSGNISGMADVYGHLEPGDAKGSVLSIADYVNGNPIDLKLHPTSRVIFTVGSSSEATSLAITGDMTFSNRDEIYDETGAMPVVEIKLADGHALRKGDSFTLITAAGKSALEVSDWSFRVQYPKAYTWEVKELTDGDGYKLIATVTDTAYSGQGDVVQSDIPVFDGEGNDAFIVDWTIDYDDVTPLRDYASQIGKSIGVAVPVWKFNLTNSSDAKTSVTAGQFNIVVAENEMKIDATEPSRGNFALDNARKLINFADANDMAVRGHTLVWHSQVPGWISSDGKKNNHKYTKEQLEEIMRDHINGVAGTLKGKVREWDVVNECLDDDQSVILSNPSGYRLRSSIWKDVIGEEFIEQAFRMAHEADPDAVLYLNDYGVEFMGEWKAEAFYNLTKNLVEKGVPIHGVGLQCHITSGQLDARRLKQNIHRYQALGLKCIITELDIAQADPSAADASKHQAEDYCAAVMAALSEDNCPTVMIWGLCDPDSWRQNNPLLYDGNVTPKEAYYGVHAALRALVARSDAEELEIDLEEIAPEISRIEYYDIHGRKLTGPATGLLIKRIIFSDGSVKSSKEIIR